VGLGFLYGPKARTLQIFTRFAPGAWTLRVWLHRWRGVKIGESVFLGTDLLLETGFPHLVSIGNNVAISMRTVIIAHDRDLPGEEKLNDRDAVSVRIEDDVFIGPCCVILPGLTIGRGAVVNAGSVVTKSVPPGMMVRGNPAAPIAKCTVPFNTSSRSEFLAGLRPLGAKRRPSPPPRTTDNVASLSGD